MSTVRSDEAIDEILDACARQADEGGSKWPGMTYEQGVDNALRWVTGQTDENPMEDE